MRNRNSGLVSSARSATSMPASNPFAPPASALALLYRSSGTAMSRSVTGRRKARRAKADTIFLAQAASSPRAAGRHTKMRPRLGVSPTAPASSGPAIETEWTAG